MQSRFSPARMGVPRLEGRERPNNAEYLKSDKTIIDISEHELFSVFNKEKIQELLPQIADIETREQALDELVSLRSVDNTGVSIDHLKDIVEREGWDFDEFQQEWESSWALKIQDALRHWVESVETTHVESQISWRDKGWAGLKTKAGFMAKTALPVIFGTAGIGAIARFATGGTGIGTGAITGAAAGLFRRMNRKREAVKTQGQIAQGNYVARLEQLRDQIKHDQTTKQHVADQIESQTPIAIVSIMSEVIRQGSAKAAGLETDANEELLKEDVLHAKSEREGSKEEALELRADALISGLYNESDEDQKRIADIANGNPVLLDALEKITHFRMGEVGEHVGSDKDVSSSKKNNAYHRLDKKFNINQEVKRNVFGSAAAMLCGGAIGGAIMYDSVYRMIPGAMAGAVMGMKVGHEKDKEAQAEAFINQAKKSIDKAEQVLFQYEHSDLNQRAFDQISGIESDLRIALQMGVLRNEPALFYRARNVIRRIDSNKVEIESRDKNAEEMLRSIMDSNERLIKEKDAFIHAFEKRPKKRAMLYGLAGAIAGGLAVQAFGSVANSIKEMLGEVFSDNIIQSPQEQMTVDSSDASVPEIPKASGVEIDSLPNPDLDLTETAEVQEAPEVFDELGITNPETLQELKNLQNQFPSLDNQELKQYLDLAELEKGQGPEHRLIKQMNFLSEHLDGADKDKFHDMVGYKEGDDVTLKTRIGRASHRLAISQRYMTGDNKYLAYPKWKDGVKQYYVLGANEEGKFHFTHEQPTGKDLEVHLDEAKESNIARRARLDAQDNSDIKGLRERILSDGNLSEVDQDAEPRTYAQPPEEISEVLKERVLDKAPEVANQNVEIENTPILDMPEAVPIDNTQVLDAPEPVPTSHVEATNDNVEVGEAAVGVKEYTGYKGPDTVDQLVETDRYVREYGNLDHYSKPQIAQYHRLKNALGWQYELFGKNGTHLKTMAQEMGVDIKNPEVASKLKSIMRHHYDTVSDFKSGTRRNLSLSAIEGKVRANMFGGNKDVPTSEHMKDGKVFDRDTFKEYQKKSLQEYLKEDLDKKHKLDIEIERQKAQESEDKFFSKKAA